MNTQSNQMTTGDNLALYQAIKYKKLEVVKTLLESLPNINAPVLTTGPFAGFTALHVACMEKYVKVVELLVNHYKADVNVVAGDGTQPLHLVALQDHPEKIGFMLLWCLIQNDDQRAKLNGNIEIDRYMFSKYAKDLEWCPEFADKMSLTNFCLIYDMSSVLKYIPIRRLDVSQISLTNRTVLMYAIKESYDKFACRIINSGNAGDLNHCDNYGKRAIHYIFDPQKYGDFRYVGLLKGYEDKYVLVRKLFKKGADMYALVNDDPSTFLLNMAAYRHFDLTITYLLAHCTSIHFSRALYYATIPVDQNSDKYLRLLPEDFDLMTEDGCRDNIEEMRETSIEVILKDLVNRTTFGLYAPEEEIKLMENLIATDTNIKNLVDDYKETFIQGKLKNNFIELSGEELSVYDLMMRVFDQRQWMTLGSDKVLKKALRETMNAVQIFENVCYESDDYNRICYLMLENIKYCRIRLELRQKLNKLGPLKKAIPLPYEIILYIIDYVPNRDFKTFIKAFFVD